MSALSGWLFPHAAVVAGLWLLAGPRWAGAILLVLGVLEFWRRARDSAKGGA